MGLGYYVTVARLENGQQEHRVRQGKGRQVMGVSLTAWMVMGYWRFRVGVVLHDRRFEAGKGMGLRAGQGKGFHALVPSSRFRCHEDGEVFGLRYLVMGLVTISDVHLHLVRSLAAA